MTKEESSGGGLLSKVARFVRHPTVNWSDLDGIEAERDSNYSKQMLKEMVDRKRRNDFVRRREFAHLRKLRQREVVVSDEPPIDSVARPSVFPSSMASPGERAVTLRKIDEIEAQMSQQWWRTKQQDSSSSAAPPAVGDAAAAAGAPATSTAFASTMPLTQPPALWKDPAEPLFDGDSAGNGMVEGAAPGATASASATDQPLAPFEHNPELEEAAILFANADYEGAQQALTQVLTAQAQSSESLEVWMALFDLYRATGQHEQFDALGIDFAARFGRSGPLWFSMPEQLGLPSVGGAQTPQESTETKGFVWNAPPNITVQSVAALHAALARSPSPWTLAWSRVANVDASAVSLLADLFAQWAARADVSVKFTAADALHQWLQSKTPTGERDTSPEMWRLRLAALRLAGQMDAFEMAALDYCVTYEVSPPAWELSRCTYSDDSTLWADAAPPLSADSQLLSTSFGDAGSSAYASMSPEEPRSALTGHVQEDATAALEAIVQQTPRTATLRIACDRLIRVDFAAAGSVLNWAAAQQSEGRTIQFLNMHRLLAVFFNVIGINAHATIVPRRD